MLFDLKNLTGITIYFPNTIKRIPFTKMCHSFKNIDNNKTAPQPQRR